MSNRIVEITKQIEDSIAVKAAFLQNSEKIAQLDELVFTCFNALKQGNKIIFAGNGGLGGIGGKTRGKVLLDSYGGRVGPQQSVYVNR